MRALSSFGLTATGLLLLTLVMAVPAAHAGPYTANRCCDGRILGYVTVDSFYNPGTVTGPIRQGPLGLQVRLPGGTWLYCGRTCGDTLRENTLDFWRQFKGSDGR